MTVTGSSSFLEPRSLSDTLLPLIFLQFPDAPWASSVLRRHMPFPRAPFILFEQTACHLLGNSAGEGTPDDTTQPGKKTAEGLGNPPVLSLQMSAMNIGLAEEMGSFYCPALNLGADCHLGIKIELRMTEVKPLVGVRESRAVGPGHTGLLSSGTGTWSQCCGVRCLGLWGLFHFPFPVFSRLAEYCSYLYIISIIFRAACYMATGATKL